MTSHESSPHGKSRMGCHHTARVHGGTTPSMRPQSTGQLVGDHPQHVDISNPEPLARGSARSNFKTSRQGLTSEVKPWNKYANSIVLSRAVGLEGYCNVIIKTIIETTESAKYSGITPTIAPTASNPIAFTSAHYKRTK